MLGEQGARRMACPMPRHPALVADLPLELAAPGQQLSRE